MVRVPLSFFCTAGSCRGLHCAVCLSRPRVSGSSSSGGVFLHTSLCRAPCTADTHLLRCCALTRRQWGFVLRNSAIAMYLCALMSLVCLPSSKNLGQTLEALEASRETARLGNYVPHGTLMTEPEFLFPLQPHQCRLSPAFLHICGQKRYLAGGGPCFVENQLRDVCTKACRLWPVPFIRHKCACGWAAESLCSSCLLGLSSACLLGAACLPAVRGPQLSAAAPG